MTTTSPATESPAVDPVVTHHLQYWTDGVPSDVGIRVARLLDEWKGLNHFEESLMKKVDWTNEGFIKLRLCGQLSTFDFCYLTTLVFLAHDHCIRVEIGTCNPRYMTLLFHPRHLRAGRIFERHPTLEEAVELWRQRHQTVSLPAAG